MISLSWHDTLYIYYVSNNCQDITKNSILPKDNFDWAKYPLKTVMTFDISIIFDILSRYYKNLDISIDFNWSKYPS